MNETATNQEPSKDDEVPKAEPKLPTINAELREFIEHLFSLHKTFQVTMDAILAEWKIQLDQLSALIEENTKISEEGGERSTRIGLEEYYEFEAMNRKAKAYRLSWKIIPKSYVMSLVSQYDAYLARLIRAIYFMKPELLSTSDRELTFAQLVKFNSLEDAKEFILEKEVESVLRESHIKHFQWMEGKFKINLRQNLDVWPDFVEVTERRNLFVHNNGYVSSQYLKICEEQGVKITGIKVGDELAADKEYFEHAHNVIFEMGFKLAHVLWRKFSPEDLAAADSNLIEIGYDYPLAEENYPLTQIVFDFATETLKKHSSEAERLVMVVNRALGYKWAGNNEKAQEIVSAEDWSAAAPRFRLASAILMDDFDTAYQIMKSIGKNHGEVSKGNYRQWPLFKVIRTEKRFRETFQEIYGEPFETIDTETLDDLSLPPEGA